MSHRIASAFGRVIPLAAMAYVLVVVGAHLAIWTLDPSELAYEAMAGVAEYAPPVVASLVLTVGVAVQLVGRTGVDTG